jgi:hypothetical protein
VLYSKDGNLVDIGYKSVVVGMGINLGQIVAGLLAFPIGRQKFQCMTVFIVGGAFLGSELIGIECLHKLTRGPQVRL